MKIMVSCLVLNKVCNGAIIADKGINYAEVAAALNPATSSCEGYSLLGLIDESSYTSGKGPIYSWSISETNPFI